MNVDNKENRKIYNALRNKNDDEIIDLIISLVQKKNIFKKNDSIVQEDNGANDIIIGLKKTNNQLKEKNTGMMTLILYIRKILGLVQDESQALNISKNEIQESINQRDDKILSLEEQVKEHQGDINILNEVIKNNHDKITYLESNFNKILELERLYKTLSVEHKNNLKNIFKTDTCIGLLVCGVQEKNIKSLWDYIKDGFVNSGVNNEDYQRLSKMFDIIFQEHKTYNTTYEYLNTHAKTKFDEDENISHGSGERGGTVRTVVFKGYKNTKLDKVLAKSLVVLE